MNQGIGKPISGTIEAAESLRILDCACCGITFAVPLAFWLERSAVGGSVHCPCGHANAIRAKAQAENLQLLAIELAGELANVKAQLEREKLRAATAEAEPPSGPISVKEVRRRSEILASRAERDFQMRPICRFCGRPKSLGSLGEHIRNRHRDELKALPAGIFE
jgi:hypothetical protein